MNDYIPILIQSIVVLIFVFISMTATSFIGPKRNNIEKLLPFESGIPSIGNSRLPISVKYFMIAIFFVIFDVEIIFLYPWAVNFRELGSISFLEIICFMLIIVSALFYIKKHKII
ncbi:MAG: NADH-quinone oxidoreductase subunit A [Bacteroides sp.]|nr:MAG: NADH-quinone oxidoreductase subunit A [Bacteroides sp.]